MEFSYVGARAPARERRVESDGVEIAVYEWGDAAAPPVLLAHGGFDFARTYDVFAPLIADAGWRVISWDHRGHGHSAHTELYSWEADQRDMLAVLDATTDRPCPAIGHSKGGSMLTQFIEALPHRFTRFVAIDGLPSKRPHPDVAEHERTKLLADEVGAWLDHRRRAADLIRKPGTPEELAKRRQRMNPRLSLAWLLYLVGVGAREDADGWRWRIDPSLRFGGFGPWRSEWALQRLPGFPLPLLGILGTEREPMDWGTTPKNIEPYLPVGARVEAIPDTGHFVHIERPQRVAELVLEFLAA
jgi:pimeloyl-ACP methyl ester carboxylesterase